MDLSAALNIQPGDLVAFVGAGGKTTTIWHLLRSLAARKERVIFATTTHIFKPRRAPLLLNPYPDPAQVALVLTRWSALILAAELGEEGDPQMAAHCPYPATARKLNGLKPEVVTDLARRLPGVTWLVEADGAKGRALKAPADHEPVIPSGARRVVVVGSLAALGRPLDDGTVHRAERAAALLRVPLGVPITPDMVAGLLGHAGGGLRAIPPRAAVVALLTQPEPDPRPEAAAIARQLLLGRRIRRVVLANLRAPDPILEVWE
jgi:molybdenum cofactor cytidylyltransferase